MQPSSTRVVAPTMPAGGLNAVFSYASPLCVPVPIDRRSSNPQSKAKSRKRDQGHHHPQRPRSSSQASTPSSHSSASARLISAFTLQRQHHSGPSSGSQHSRSSSETTLYLTNSATTASDAQASSAAELNLSLGAVGEGEVGVDNGPRVGLLHVNRQRAAVTGDRLYYSLLPPPSPSPQTSPLSSVAASSPDLASASSASASHSHWTRTTTAAPHQTRHHNHGRRTTSGSRPGPESRHDTAVNHFPGPPTRKTTAGGSTSPRMIRIKPSEGLPGFDHRNVSSQTESDSISKFPTVRQMTGLLNRAESVSSTSVTTTLSAGTMTSNDFSAFAARPFIHRNGRTYLNDATLPYQLPSDLAELHRQTLRTLLLIQVFGAPVCTPSLINKPPQRVLEIGCGSGFWSMMCHQYYKARGHSNISFTGVDIAPLAPDSSNSMAADALKPDPDMNWRFVQYDLRSMPWPFADDEFDLVMVKDMSLAMTCSLSQACMDEYIRILKPGGTLEIWESDHVIRMLRDHRPSANTEEEFEEQAVASSLGAYVMNQNTPLTPPSNLYLFNYNMWVCKALESHDLSPMPCAAVLAALIQEPALKNRFTRRLAIPLSEARWEKKEGVGVITKDGKLYDEGRGKDQLPRSEKKALTAGQLALRQTAMLTVVQQIQALEHTVRELNKKSQDEWDVWVAKMMNDLMNENGAGWGECLEVGAFSAKKR